ncbi:MAG: VOC family protein [Candidatus Cloacimonadales bacterium]|nr:VOC family protein [Candidatus Cloacimonadales bacterium]
MNTKPYKIEWLVIPANDLEKAAEFYSTIFNWKISKFSPEFWLFDADTIHGGFDSDLKPNSDGIRFSITVESIEETLQEIEHSGGKKVKEKYGIGLSLGYTASFCDPNGNIVELWAEK